MCDSDNISFFGASFIFEIGTMVIERIRVWKKFRMFLKKIAARYALGNKDIVANPPKK